MVATEPLDASYTGGRGHSSLFARLNRKQSLRVLTALAWEILYLTLYCATASSPGQLTTTNDKEVQGIHDLLRGLY